MTLKIYIIMKPESAKELAAHILWFDKENPNIVAYDDVELCRGIYDGDLESVDDLPGSLTEYQDRALKWGSSRDPGKSIAAETKKLGKSTEGKHI